MFLSIINLECEVSPRRDNLNENGTNNSTTETKQWWDLYTDFDAFSSVLREKGLEILLENYRFVELSKQLRSENSLIKGE